jgi:hypothetical protein
MLFRTDEAKLSLAEAGRPWAFDAPGEEFKLAAEAYRINLAHLFDPMMAVHTSNVEPLPHQITAVYESMLPRQPLRYVLADDPGAGKTIMAGLFIRELLMRADAKRVLIVAPGSLVEQWQDEMFEKFGLSFRCSPASRSSSRAAATPSTTSTAWSPASTSSPAPKTCRKAAPLALGPDRRRRSAQALGQLLRQQGQQDQALPARRAAGLDHPSLPADDRHAAQRQGRRLPAVHVAAGLRPLLRQVPRRRAQGRCHRPDAPHGQGRAAQVRRHAAVPRAPRLHRQLQAVGSKPRSTSAVTTT